MISSVNNGDSARYHLVWDMLLTKQTAEAMFFGGLAAPFVDRIEGAEPAQATNPFARGDATPSPAPGGPAVACRGRRGAEKATPCDGPTGP